MKRSKACISSERLGQLNKFHDSADDAVCVLHLTNPKIYREYHFKESIDI